MATSYNGWQASRDPEAISVGDFRYRDQPFPAGVKRGDVATVMQYLVNALATRVEPFNDGYGCWGYNYRANVNNPSSLSCHASGTAIDWRAPQHPNGQVNTFTRAQYATIDTILAELGHVVRHLRSYDEMHFEIRSGPTEVQTVARRIRAGQAAPVPSQPTNQEDKMDAADREWVAAKLNESEGQIMGAIRAELAQAVESITGGTRRRDAAGNVIDPDPANVSNADNFTRIEKAVKDLTAAINARG